MVLANLIKCIELGRRWSLWLLIPFKLKKKKEKSYNHRRKCATSFGHCNAWLLYYIMRFELVIGVIELTTFVLTHIMLDMDH